MINNIISTITLLLITYCFLSCDDDRTDVYYIDNTNSRYECIEGTTEFFNDGDNIFSYTCDGEWVELFFDIVGDETNQLEGNFPNRDLFRLYVDSYNNGILDANKDIMLARASNGSICKSFLLSQTNTSQCFYSDYITQESNFSKTDNSSNDHFNFKLSLPKYNLNTGSKANLVIEIYDPESGWSRYPSDAELFTDSFEINL